MKACPAKRENTNVELITVVFSFAGPEIPVAFL